MKVSYLLIILMQFVLFVPLSGNPGGRSGVLRIISYNVAGLWGPVSASDPGTNSILISPRLNEYDLVLLQEDFNYHEDLKARATHTFKSKHSGIMGFGDGLTRFSRFPFETHTRVEWSDCYGFFHAANDCMTPKGFSFARHRIQKNVMLDVYNLHADAGDGSRDKATRQKNFRQLLKFIDRHSKGRAVIIAGDFNATINEGSGLYIFASAGFKDARFSGPGNGDLIDKILYRSAGSVRLKARSYGVPAVGFQNMSPLSDHDPIGVQIEYWAE